MLKAAKESTLSYQQNRLLGHLIGIPVIVKDEYDIEGYTMCLTSVHNLTGQASFEAATPAIQ